MAQDAVEQNIEDAVGLVGWPTFDRVEVIRE